MNLHHFISFLPPYLLIQLISFPYLANKIYCEKAKKSSIYRTASVHPEYSFKPIFSCVDHFCNKAILKGTLSDRKRSEIKFELVKDKHRPESFQYKANERSIHCNHYVWSPSLSSSFPSSSSSSKNLSGHHDWITGSVSVCNDKDRSNIHWMVTGLFHNGLQIITIVPAIDPATESNEEQLYQSLNDEEGSDKLDLRDHLYSVIQSPDPSLDRGEKDEELSERGLNKKNDLGPPNSPINLGVFKLQELRMIQKNKPIPENSQRIFGFSFTKDRPMFIKLAIVNDVGIYERFKGNRNHIRRMNQMVVAMVSALFQPLNIAVLLMDTIIWDYTDGIQYSKNPMTTLGDFHRYREAKLLPKYENYTTYLLASYHFGNTYGYSLIGSVCSRLHTGGVVVFWPESIAITAIIMAHEIGHTLGMWHDLVEDCYCTDKSCIMSSVISMYLPKRWSQCSQQSVRYLQHSGYDGCLYDPPVSHQARSPFCGNGFLEPGEQCDCGLNECGNCCDWKTCKLRKNAKCGTGKCCDPQTCQPYLKSDHKICRHSNSPCDIAEYCDGKSEFCPADRRRQNGGPCFQDGICYNGFCASRRVQCQLLWGPNADVAPVMCYNYNTNGTLGADCGFDYQLKRLIPCHREDAFCGRLQCITPTNSSFRFLAGHLIQINNPIWKSTICKSLLSVSEQLPRDPGLVPDGSICGPNRVCKNSRCVSIEEVSDDEKCENKCSERQVCDDLGQCQCKGGFAGEDCMEEVPSDDYLGFDDDQISMRNMDDYIRFFSSTTQVLPSYILSLFISCSTLFIILMF